MAMAITFSVLAGGCASIASTKNWRILKTISPQIFNYIKPSFPLASVAVSLMRSGFSNNLGNFVACCEIAFTWKGKFYDAKTNTHLRWNGDNGLFTWIQRNREG